MSTVHMTTHLCESNYRTMHPSVTNVEIYYAAPTSVAVRWFAALTSDAVPWYAAPTSVAVRWYVALTADTVPRYAAPTSHTVL